MAEALAVVGIVANITQLVDFGAQVLKRFEEYQSTLTEIPEAFRHIKAELPVLLDALTRRRSQLTPDYYKMKAKGHSFQLWKDVACRSRRLTS
jgi:hypothetical protein